MALTDVGPTIGRLLESIQRRIAGGIQFVFAVIARVLRPVHRRVSAAGGSRVRELAVLTADVARVVVERVRRWLAVRLPRVPAPSVGLPGIGTLHTRHIAGGLGLVGLVCLPIPLTAFQLVTLVVPIYLMVYAMSWDFVSGYTGQISLGHSFFFALGAYTSTVMNLQHGITPLLSIPSGALVAGLGGLVIGFPALRIRGPYLSLVTLVSPLILLQLVILFNSSLRYLAPSGLGGATGFVATNDPLIATGPEAVVTVTTYAWSVLFDYYLALALFAVTFAVLFVITRSQTGDILTAIRENEDTVAAVGFNVAKFKLFAFVISAIFGGFAGAVFVHSVVGNPLNPQQILVVAVSVDIVVMAILGGMGTIVGAAVGATFFVTASYVLESFGGAVVIPLVGESLASLMPAPLLVLALLVVVFRPRGLVPALVDAGRWLATDPADRPATEPDAEGDAPLEQVLERYRDAFDR